MRNLILIIKKKIIFTLSIAVIPNPKKINIVKPRQIRPIITLKGRSTTKIYERLLKLLSAKLILSFLNDSILKIIFNKKKLTFPISLIY